MWALLSLVYIKGVKLFAPSRNQLSLRGAVHYQQDPRCQSIRKQKLKCVLIQRVTSPGPSGEAGGADPLPCSILSPLPALIVNAYRSPARPPTPPNHINTAVHVSGDPSMRTSIDLELATAGGQPHHLCSAESPRWADEWGSLMMGTRGGFRCVPVGDWPWGSQRQAQEKKGIQWDWLRVQT